MLFLGCVFLALIKWWLGLLLAGFLIARALRRRVESALAPRRPRADAAARSAAALYLGIGIVYAVLSLGPDVKLFDTSFGKGPWDALQDAWIATHDRRHAAAEAGAIVDASLPLVPLVAEVAIEAPLRAFGGRSLRDLVDPARVSPAALEALHQRVGDALFTSAHWLWTEPLRILGLTGLRLATRPLETRPALELQRTSMLRIGGAAASA